MRDKQSSQRTIFCTALLISSCGSCCLQAMDKPLKTDASALANNHEKKEQQGLRKLATCLGIWIATAALTAAADWAIEGPQGNPNPQLFNMLQLRKKDICFCIGTTGFFTGLDALSTDDVKTLTGQMILRVPAIMGLNLIVQSRLFNNIMQHSPILSDCMACSERNCPGICEECNLRKATLATLIYTAIRPSLGKLVKWIKKQFQGIGNQYNEHTEKT